MSAVYSWYNYTDQVTQTKINVVTSECGSPSKHPELCTTNVFIVIIFTIAVISERVLFTQLSLVHLA